MDLLDKMQTYVRVIETGSLSAAARQLRISVAAVSRQIVVLEAEVGAPLLVRSTRRMAITSLGQRYYERCLAILRQVEDAHALASAEAGLGELHVSAPLSFALARIVPHLHDLIVKHPGLLIDLRLEDRLVDNVLDGVDVAIRVGASPPESSALIAQPLTSFTRVIVAAPKYLKRKGAPQSVEALTKHDALSGTRGAWSLRNGTQEARGNPRAIFRSNTLQGLHALSVRGLGLAFLPEWLVAEDIARGVLRRVLPAWRSPPVDVHALYRVENRGTPRIRVLIDHLRASYAKPETSRAHS